MNRNIEVGCLVMCVDAVDEGIVDIGRSGIVSGELTNDLAFRRHIGAHPDWRYWDVEGMGCYHITDQLIRIDNQDTSADEVEIERDMELVK